MKCNSAAIICRQFYVVLLLCVLMSLITSNVHATGESGQESSTTLSVKRSSSHPYCGLYCLYATMRLADQKIDFRELLKPEYVSSRKGSSFAELEKAAEDHGMYAWPASNLTSRELRYSAYPIILHTKSSLSKKKYDHYELFLGTQNGKARLVDLF